MLYRDMRRFVEADLQQVETTIARHLDTDVPFIEETAGTSCRAAANASARRCSSCRPACVAAAASACTNSARLSSSSTPPPCCTTTSWTTPTCGAAILPNYGHSLWGNEISILIGDYLYAKAMSLALADKDHLVMETVSDVTVEMAKGQVIETLKQRDLGISESEYYRIIGLKTASLFAASCKIGAIIGGIRRRNAPGSKPSDTTWGWLFRWLTTRWISCRPRNKLGKR